MSAATKTIRCSVCRTEVEVDYHRFIGARWLSLPPGWMILLDCVGGDPHVRCSGCMPQQSTQYADDECGRCGGDGDISPLGHGSPMTCPVCRGSGLSSRAAAELMRG